MDSTPNATASQPERADADRPIPGQAEPESAVPIRWIEGFAGLFAGLTDNFALWERPQTGNAKGRYRCAQRPIGDADWRGHLSDGPAITMTPIRRDNTALFGAIDLDTHGAHATEVDHAKVAQDIARLELPLTLTRSKSGGGHAYCFLTEPVPAAELRERLGMMAAALGFAGAELFPKQDRLGPEDVGSGINLAYWSGDDTMRYGYTDDGEVFDTIDDFIAAAEARRISPAALRALDVAPASEQKHAGGSNGAAGDPGERSEQKRWDGSAAGRNEYLFKLGCQMRARGWDDDQVEHKLRHINRRADPEDNAAFADGPLDDREIELVIRQVLKKEKGERKANEKPAEPKTASPEGLRRAAQISPRRGRWLWHPRLPADQITILAAPGGRGKGLIGCQMAAVITNGGTWPDGERLKEPGDVLWCETEDDIEVTLIPRLIAAGADLARVTLCDAKTWPRLDLRAFIENNGVKLIVLSPMLSFLNELRDKNDEMDVRHALEGLLESVRDTGCGVLGLCHTNKKTDLGAIERILGSGAFTTFVRCILLAAAEEPKGNEEGTEEVFRLVHGKFSTSRRGRDMLYRPVNTCRDEDGERGQYVKLEWSVAPTNCDKDTAFDRKRGKDADDDTASGWLLHHMRDVGEAPAKEVIAAGVKHGYKEDAIIKARSRHKHVIDSRRDGHRGPWIWRYFDPTHDHF